MKRKYYIAIYEGGAIYEPAEGGYYVPVLELDSVSNEQYSEKHARRTPPARRHICQKPHEAGRQTKRGGSRTRRTTTRASADTAQKVRTLC